MNHLVTLEEWDLKMPPAPQQRPLEWAAPSKQAKVKPRFWVNSQTCNGRVLIVDSFQEKDDKILCVTERVEGVRSSKIALFLSIQSCQHGCAAKLTGVDFSFDHSKKQSRTEAASQWMLREKWVSRHCQTALENWQWMRIWWISSADWLHNLQIPGPS